MRSTAVALALAVGGGLALRVESASTSTSTGSTIIYVGIGIIALLFLLAAFLVWRCHRNRARQRQERAMTGLPPPSAAHAFRLEIGEGDEAEVAERARDQRQHRHHKRQTTPPPESEYGQHPQTPAIDFDAFQDARSNEQLQPADLYYHAEAPLNVAAPSSPVAAAVRQSGTRQHNGERDAQAYQEQQYQQDRRLDRHQELSDRVGSDQPAGRDYAAQMAAERLGTDNARAAERVQDTLARVLSDFDNDPVLAQWRIPESSLYFTRVLSKGAFGEVWLAQFESRQVAVKRILKEKRRDEKEIECFAAEIRLMATLSHPKIVEFVGVSWSATNDLCAVTEYMAKGDLYGFLKQHAGKLNWRDHKIFLAEDVADALGYLHGLSPKVIHRDLKSKNILLDDAFRAKLSDFGISRERSVEDTMTAGVGTIYWTAPEVLMGKKYTEKADIYSFGIVMSELDTHQVPYSDKRDDSGKKLQGMKIVQMVIKRNMRPTLSPDCPWQIRELIDRCVNVNPDVRPDAPELLHLIRCIEDDLE